MQNKLEVLKPNKTNLTYGLALVLLGIPVTSYADYTMNNTSFIPTMSYLNSLSSNGIKAAYYDGNVYFITGDINTISDTTVFYTDPFLTTVAEVDGKDNYSIQNITTTGGYSVEQISDTSYANAQTQSNAPIFQKITSNGTESYVWTIPDLTVYKTSSDLDVFNMVDSGNGGINYYIVDTDGNVTSNTYYYTGVTENHIYDYVSGNVIGQTPPPVGYTPIQTDVINAYFLNTYSISGNPAGHNFMFNGTFINNSDNHAELSGNVVRHSDGLQPLSLLSGIFLGNSGEGVGGAIYNDKGQINNIIGDFVINGARSGGAIYNSGIIDNIIGDFIGNLTIEDLYNNDGGAIFNVGMSTNTGLINSISGNFIGNHSAENGGAIYNYNGNININSYSTELLFSENFAQKGGAIYNYVPYNNPINGVLNISANGANLQFLHNSAESGGAIYNNGGTININAMDGNILFSENTNGAIVNTRYNMYAPTHILNINATGGDVIFNNNPDGAIIDLLSGEINLYSSDNHKISFLTDSDDVVLDGTSVNIGLNTHVDMVDILGTGTINNNHGALTVAGNVSPTVLINNDGGLVDILANYVSNVNSYNYGILTLTGGTLDSKPNQNSYIIGGAVTNNVSLAGDSIRINIYGSLETSATNISGTNMVNVGILTLTGGTVGNFILNNGISLNHAGDIVITGNVVSNDSNLRANNITINENNSLTINADNIVVNNLINNGILYLGAGFIGSSVVADNCITGTGTIITTANLSGNADVLGNDINNDYNFTLSGGTISKNITGNGTVFVDGNVTIDDVATVAQNITINEDKQLSVSASNINSSILDNGTLNLTGGTLTSTNITGNGNILITGSVISNVGINQSLQIAQNALLSINADNILNTISNNGTVALSGGTLTQQIAGNINIIGDVYTSASNLVSDNITNNSNNLTLTGGILTHSITGTGNTVINGDVTVSEPLPNTSVSIANNITINSNAELHSNASALQNTVQNNGELYLTGGTIENNIVGGSTIIDGIVNNNAVLSTSTVINANKSLSTLANGIGGTINNAGTLTLTGGTLNHQITGNGVINITDYTYTSANNLLGTGNISNTSTLELTGGTLQQVISGNGNIVINGDVFSSASNLQNNTIISDENTLTLTGGILQKTISASGNGNIVINGYVSTQADNLLASTSLNDGTVLTLNGGTLSTQITGTGTLAINNNYSVSSSANNIGVDVNNNGYLTFSGGTLSNDITGSGQTIINGTVTNNALISQTMVVNSGKSLTTAASGIGANILNNGNVTLTGGTVNHNITGGGTVTIDGNVENNGNLGLVVINENKSLTTSANGIYGISSNNGNLYLNGGTLAYGVSGNVYITGDVTNTVNQAHSINISNGGTFTTAANLLTNTNAISNSGTLNITSGNLQQNVTGGNTIIAQNATTSATSFGNLELNGVMNVGTNTVNMANADINGTINLGISALNKNSNVYTGGHIIADDIVFGDNAMLNLTITDTNLQKGDSSGNIEIITANGEWTGDIATFTSNNLYDIAYNTENHTFTFTRKKFGADLITELNGTELDINIAGVWDELQSSDNPNIQNIINAIDYNSQHNATKYAKLIHNLAPQNHQVTVGAVRSVSTLIDNHVFTRLATLRRPQINRTNANPRKRRANPFYYYGNYRGRNGGDTEPTANNGIWVEGLYNYAQQKDDTKFSGNTFGVMGGFDSKLTEHLTAGLGYAFNKTNIDADNHDIDAMGHTGFVYAEYKPTQWYLDALLSYNLTNYQNSAALIDNLTVKSDYKTNSLSGALTSGYDFQKGLDLYGGLNYIGIKQDAYTDTAGQYIKADDTQTLTLKAGGRYKLTSQKMKRASTVLKAAVLYDVMSDDGVTTVTVGNNNYIVHGNGIDPFGVQAGIMFDSFGGNTYLSLGYDLEWRNNFISHTGYIKLKYNF